MKITTSRSKSPVLKTIVIRLGLIHIPLALSLLLVAVATVLAQTAPAPQEAQNAADAALRQGQLQDIQQDKASYAASIVARWEVDAKASGKWDANYGPDLFVALMKLRPENLLDAGEATSYEGVLAVVARSSLARARQPASQSTSQSTSQPLVVGDPLVLGDALDDLVFTPVAPCRIVDTRSAGGLISANTQRNFDADGSTFAGQGGVASSCGIPFGVAQAVVMNIAVTGPTGAGYFTAWRIFGSQPTASVLNFSAGQTISNTTIVPIFPGSGADFSLYSGQAAAHAVIDVMGYFAPSSFPPLSFTAAAPDCTPVCTAITVVPAMANPLINVDIACPAGRTATGGGYLMNEGAGGAFGFPVIGSLPGSVYGFNGWRIIAGNTNTSDRHIQACATCCLYYYSHY